MNTATKADFVDLLATRCEIPRSRAAEVIGVLLASVVDALRRGDKVELRGFGSFRVRERGPRRGRNPKTGEAVDVLPKRIPYFKPGKDLRTQLGEIVD